jgi:uncharacterized protein (TIGR02271 family)
MARIISAVFDDVQDAEKAVSWLRNNGVPDDAISVVSRGEGEGGTGRDAGEGAGDAGKGLASGLGIGAGVGALFGLAAALIPGIGPIIAAGPLAAALGATGGAIASGAIVGGTAGGIAGALSHWGLSETEAQHYAGEIERGGTFVGVDTSRANTSEAAITDAFRRFNGRIHGDASAMGRSTAAAGTTAAAYGNRDLQGEVRMPLMEETADVRKEVRQTGEVGVTKRVETETQHISEPVARERVSVEVRDVDDTAYTGATGAANLGEGETIRVPVREEELIVDKQARVGQEAVIRTHRDVEQVEQDIQLRKERLDVDADEELDVDYPAGTAGRRNV